MLGQKSKSAILKATLAVTAAGMMASAASGMAQAIELKLAHFMPPVHHLHGNVFVPFAERVAAASGGELTIKIFPAGQLGPGPVDQYKRTVEGVTDIGFICHAFTPNLFPKGLLSIQIGEARTAVDATERYYSVFEEFLADEYNEVHALAVWSAAPAIVVSRERLVTSIDDLAGMKIVTGGAAFNSVISAWGGDPVSMPLGAIQNAVSSGIADMVIISASILAPPWNLGEVSKFVAVGLPGLKAPCGLIVNQGVWDGLSPALQQVLTDASGRELALAGAASFDDEGDRALAAARNNPNLTIVDIDNAARQRFLDQATPLVRSVIADLEESGVADARSAYDALNQ